MLIDVSLHLKVIILFNSQYVPIVSYLSHHLFQKWKSSFPLPGFLLIFSLIIVVIQGLFLIMSPIHAFLLLKGIHSHENLNIFFYLFCPLNS